MGYHCTCANKGVLADRGAADDGGIRAQRGAPPYQRTTVFRFPDNGGARVVNVGKNQTWTTKHIIFQRNRVIDGNVVLNLDVVSDGDIIANKDILSK